MEKKRRVLLCVCVYLNRASILSVFLVVLEKVPSCDQERQSALDDAEQYSREAFFIPDCEPAGLYKAVQCHRPTGYCWCVLVDTGRPIPGTSTRYRPSSKTSTEFSEVKRTKSLGFIGLSGVVFPLNRYETPECDGAARSRVSDTDDPFQGRDLTGLNHFTPPNTPVPPCSHTNILVLPLCQSWSRHGDRADLTSRLPQDCQQQ